MIKSRRMRWAGHVARLGERIGVYGVLVENLRERDNLGDTGVYGKILLWFFRKWDVGVWTIELAHHTDRWQAFANSG